MTKNVWRCRCGKRAEVLTDENFGDCGCSDPVYGPEYFYMSEECADMLDEMDKDYDEQHKHLAEARAEIERLKADTNKWRVDAKSKNDARLNLESAAVSIKYWTNQSFQKDKLIEQLKAEIERLNGVVISQIAPEPLVLSSYSTTAEPAKDERDKLIEQMREALRQLESNHGGLSDENYNIVRAALEAAERNKL